MVRAQWQVLHVPPPQDEHPPPDDEAVLLKPEPPLYPNVDMSRLTSTAPHLGHFTSATAPLVTSSSNLVPHFAHRNS
jgi:hypothetical protein